MNDIDTWLPQGVFEPKRYRPGGIGNWSGHLPFASDLVSAVRPKVLVELGTHYGESYFGFCQAVAENKLGCRCYAVDTWLGEVHAGFYDETVYQDVSAYNQLHYSAFSYLLRTTFDEARRNFEDESLDILHIDGLHTYGAVLRDFENWLSTVKPGGIVLLHDISARHADFGVWKFWSELQGRGDCFEFSHSWGLGVFRKPGRGSDSAFIETLFEGSEEQSNHIRHFYALCARSLEYEHPQGRPNNSAKTTAFVQIYPETENGFVAESTYDQHVKVKEWEHVRIDVTSGTVRGKLRIDVTENSSVIDIAGIAVRKAANEELIFSAQGQEQLRALQPGGTITRLDIAGSSEFSRYISTGNDPQLYLALDSNLTDQPLVVELWIRVSFEVDVLLPSLLEQTKDTPTEIQQSVESSAADSALVEENNKLHAQLDLIQKERDSVASNHRLMQGELYVAKHDLASLRKESEKLHAEVKTLSARVSELSDENARIALVHDDLTRTNQKLSRVSRDLEATINGVVHSHSWRLTAPMRKVMAIFKAS